MECQRLMLDAQCKFTQGSLFPAMSRFSQVPCRGPLDLFREGLYN